MERSWIIALGLALTSLSCAPGRSDVSQGSAAASTSVLAETAGDEQKSDLPDRREVLPNLQDLEDLVDKTVSAPRMSFALDVTMSVPGGSSPIVAKRTGSFDDTTFAGVGTRSFVTEDEALAELWGEEPFEFIVADEALWMYNPLAEPPEWAGFDLLDFAQFAGGDPLGSVDVDGYLSLIAGAATEVIQLSEDAAGSQTWVVLVRADELVPLVAAGGPASRLVDTGAAESGLTVELEVHQTPDGYISAVRGRLDEWWTNALLSFDGLTGDETMEVDLRLETFAPVLQPDPPCLDPTPQIEDGLAVLTCEG